MPRMTVIGIGSPFADDRAGWSVVEILAASTQIAAYGERIRVALCDSPAGELLSLLADTEIAVIVDAVSYCGAPGTVYRLGNAHSPSGSVGYVSSHGVDVMTLLALAETLKHIPRVVIIYGIEVGSGIAADSKMCQSVRRAVARVAEDIRRDVMDYCAN